MKRRRGRCGTGFTIPRGPLRKIDQALLEADRILNNVLTCRHFRAKFSEEEEVMTGVQGQAQGQQQQQQQQQQPPVPQATTRGGVRDAVRDQDGRRNMQLRPPETLQRGGSERRSDRDGGL
eukprot:1869367-Amphidinium_carterae.1